MARPPRIELPGAIYHVIARGNERRPIFRDDRDREEYLGRLARYRKQFRFDLLAYCLMTNHVHLAIRTSQAPLSRAMASLQSSYAHWFNRRHERVGHLFDGRYKAFLVQEERYFTTLVGYIHMNPVRAGLVRRSESYRWSSGRFLFNGDPRPPFDRDVTLELLGLTHRKARASYGEIVTEERAIEYERLPGIGQLVKGDEEFGIQRIVSSRKSAPPFKGLSEATLIAAVADVTGFSPQSLRGVGRSPQLCTARTIAGYVGKSYAAISLRRTARYLGREDSYLCKSVARLERGIDREPDRRREVEAVVSRLGKRPTVAD